MKCNKDKNGKMPKEMKKKMDKMMGNKPPKKKK
jgi:hypothetical protein